MPGGLGRGGEPGAGPVPDAVPPGGNGSGGDDRPAVPGPHSRGELPRAGGHDPV